MATQIRPSGNRAGVNRAVRVRAHRVQGGGRHRYSGLFRHALASTILWESPAVSSSTHRGVPSVSGGALGRGSFARDAVPKPDSRSDEGYELGGIDPPPAALGHREKLEGHEQALLA